MPRLINAFVIMVGLALFWLPVLSLDTLGR